jgi:hypothetical protein
MQQQREWVSGGSVYMGSSIDHTLGNLRLRRAHAGTAGLAEPTSPDRGTHATYDIIQMHDRALEYVLLPSA